MTQQRRCFFFLHRWRSMQSDDRKQIANYLHSERKPESIPVEETSGHSSSDNTNPERTFQEDNRFCYLINILAHSLYCHK